MEIRDIIEKYPTIYNIENKEAFLQQVYGYLEQPKLTEYIRVLSAIGKIESFFEKDLMFFGLSEFIFLFENFGWVSAGTFGVRKTFVESYLGWAVNNNKIEYKNLENLKLMNNRDLTGAVIFKVSHFKNFDELQETNKAILTNEIAFQRVIDDTAFMVQETFTYLIWLRLNLEECVNLKISDIDFETKQINLNNRVIDVPDIILRKIIICSKLNEFSYSRGITIITRQYINSMYLLRSIRKSQYTINAIQQILTKYSELSGNLNVANKYYNKDLKYNNLYRSSLFSSFYDFEQKENIKLKSMRLSERSEILKQNFPHENITANMFRDYFKWKKYYYNV